MHGREHVNLLVLFVEQILELSDFGLELADTLLKRLGIASRKRSSAEFVAGTAFEANVGALGARGPDTIAANLFATTAITSLSDTALSTGADFDNLHGKYSRHLGRSLRLKNPCRGGLVRLPGGEKYKAMLAGHLGRGTQLESCASKQADQRRGLA